MPFLEIDPVMLSLGPLKIRWYAIAYIVGIVLGWQYLVRLIGQPGHWRRPNGPAGAPPLDRTQLDDVLFYVTVGIIIGGRLGFVLFYRPELLWEPFSAWPQILGFLPVPPAFAIWEGGMSFHGGLVGVGLATIYFARKTAQNPLSIGDLFACAAPIGLFFGRVANFINAELYGRPWDGPWAVKFPEYFSDVQKQWIYAVDAVPRHPSQLYEAALEGAVLFLVLRYAVTRMRILAYRGAAIGVFLAGYGASRFCVEFFRQPDTYAAPLGFLTRGMMLSLPMVFLGTWLVWWAVRQPPIGAASGAPQEPTS